MNCVDYSVLQLSYDVTRRSTMNYDVRTDDCDAWGASRWIFLPTHWDCCYLLIVDTCDARAGAVCGASLVLVAPGRWLGRTLCAEC